MDDLISRQAAIGIIQSMYPGMPRIPWMRKDWQERYEPFIRTENAIRELPSAQPETTCYLGSPCEYQNPDAKMPSAQPEIVRCKDCIHCEYALDDTWFCAKLDGIRVWADDFCSRGERRE